MTNIYEMNRYKFYNPLDPDDSFTVSADFIHEPQDRYVWVLCNIEADVIKQTREVPRFYIYEKVE